MACNDRCHDCGEPLCENQCTCSTPGYTNVGCPNEPSSGCVIYNGADIPCLAVENGDKLNSVITKLFTFTKGLFGKVSSDSLNVADGGTCTDHLTIELVPSEDNNNALILGTDGLPYVPSASSSITANNGLTETTGNIQLGGTLLTNTTINTNGHNLVLGEATDKITFSPALIKHEGTQETSEVSKTWFKNNVGIGINANGSPSSSSENNTRLKVDKGTIFSVSPINVATDSTLTFDTSGSEVSTSIYAGTFSNILWNLPGNQTLRSGTAIAGGFDYFQFNSNFATTGGNISAHAAQVYFRGTGTLDKVIGSRILSPIPDASDGFTGTLTLVVGHQIDDQRGGMSAYTTDTRGYVQVGQGDKNHFAGHTRVGGADSNAFNASAIFEVRGTDGGLVLPRMTKAQRNLIATPIAGMAVYQTDNTPGLRVYNGTNWMAYTETID